MIPIHINNIIPISIADTIPIPTTTLSLLAFDMGTKLDTWAYMAVLVTCGRVLPSMEVCPKRWRPPKAWGPGQKSIRIKAQELGDSWRLAASYNTMPAQPPTGQKQVEQGHNPAPCDQACCTRLPLAMFINAGPSPPLRSRLP